MNIDKTTISNKFKEVFHTDVDEVYFSPGRINLIGEHTDYNGGHVFPLRISLRDRTADTDAERMDW